METIGKTVCLLGKKRDMDEIMAFRGSGESVSKSNLFLMICG